MGVVAASNIKLDFINISPDDSKKSITLMHVNLINLI